MYIFNALQISILSIAASKLNSYKISDRMAPPSSPNPSENLRRWQKTPSSNLLQSSSSFLRPNQSVDSGLASQDNQRMIIIDPETDAHIEGLLATEASLVVLDALELIVQVMCIYISMFIYRTDVLVAIVHLHMVKRI